MAPLSSYQHADGSKSDGFTVLPSAASKMILETITQQLRPALMMREDAADDFRKLQRKSRRAASSRRNRSCSPWQSSEVSFGTVSIAEFPTIIGDHPCCSSDGGCPIALSPVAIKEVTAIPVQFYEFQRLSLSLSSSSAKPVVVTQHPTTRRKQHQEVAFRLTSRQRADRLTKAGFSHEDIHRAAQAAFQCRAQRERCNKQMSLDGVHSLLEKTTRRIRKIILLPSASSSTPNNHNNNNNNNNKSSCSMMIHHKITRNSPPPHPPPPHQSRHHHGPQKQITSRSA